MRSLIFACNLKLNNMKIRSQYFLLALTLLIVGCSSKQTDMEKQIELKIDSLLTKMTLEEKVNMIHGVSSFTSGGVERLNVRGFVMSDGPHGVRMEHGTDWKVDTVANNAATYLPVGITLASTWNKELGYKFGEVLGSEAKYRGKDIILGPGVNILRTPLNGRNFEYLSEDPYLAGKMAAGYIKGVQDQGIAACVKHFAANNQEKERFTINVEVSERALREIYLPAFEMAVKEGGVYTIMGAYNQFRGQHCSHNDYLLNKILKGEWGFEGIVISDWAAVHNSKQALENGCDIEMGTDLSMRNNPDYNKFYMADSALILIRNGEVDSSVVDEKVKRILRVMYRINMFGKRSPGSYNTPEHQQVARKVAEEGIVLLKNETVLPLNKQKINKIAVVGANADKKFGKRGGSSQVEPYYEVTALEGLKNSCGSDIEIVYAPGYEITKKHTANQQLASEAINASKNADFVIYVGGTIHGFSDAWSDNAYDAEGADKPDMYLPFQQDELIKKILEVNKNVIVALYGGGPVDMTEWIDEIPAIIQAWYPGMEGGNVLADILFGNVNPSGKLPMTFPKKLEDSPAHKLGEYPGDNGTVEYKDGIYVGYRFFDTKGVEPQFCFGHGLSFTTFEFTNVSANLEGDQVLVSVKITNTGDMAGAEVAQFYVHDDESKVERPEKELKAFEKVYLEPGGSKIIEVKIPVENLKYYDEGLNKWVLERGVYEILVGNSSANIIWKLNIEI